MSPNSRRDPSRTAAGEFLEEDRFIDDAGVRSAVLLRVLQAQKIQGAESFEPLARKLLGFFPLVDVRTDLLVDEAADSVPKLLVLGPKEMRTRRGYVRQ